MGFITPGFDFFEIQSPYLEMWAALAGLVVGSFLNVLALRSLSGASMFTPFSKCPKCDHRLGVLDLIPVVSYVLLGGRCRYCKDKIAWHYPVVEAATALLFAAVVHHFSQAAFAPNPDRVVITLGMLFLTAILVAVTVTDFKEKLIPHEITYPSIIVGLFFSLMVRRDLLGAMAGVGASYILFDFIAFYGLKIYLWLNKDADLDELEKSTIIEPEGAIDEVDEEIDKSFDIVRTPSGQGASGLGGEDDEPFEVMGGGDAVLSAVMAAWLGWEKLLIALVIGFMMGAVMGACYLVYELKQEKRLGELIKPALGGFVAFFGFFALIIVGWANFVHMTEILTNVNLWILNLVVGLGGLTFGVIRSKSALAKPFPFGPSLAFGGMYAIFMINIVDGTYIKN